MKITKSQLKTVIKEEYNRLLNEISGDDRAMIARGYNPFSKGHESMPKYSEEQKNVAMQKFQQILDNERVFTGNPPPADSTLGKMRDLRIMNDNAMIRRNQRLLAKVMALVAKYEKENPQE